MSSEAEANREQRALRAVGRQCGECTVCCTAMGVPELKKPAWTKCAHVCATGCAIYPVRPKGCADFFCLWRQGFGEEEWRPDLLGAVLSVRDEVASDELKSIVGALVREQHVQVHLLSRDALQNPALQAAIARVRRTGVLTVVLFEGRGKAYGPDAPNGIAVVFDTEK